MKSIKYVIENRFNFCTTLEKSHVDYNFCLFVRVNYDE